MLTDSKPWWTWKDCILNGNGDVKNSGKRQIKEIWDYDDHDKVLVVTSPNKKRRSSICSSNYWGEMCVITFRRIF